MYTQYPVNVINSEVFRELCWNSVIRFRLMKYFFINTHGSAKNAQISMYVFFLNQNVCAL